MNTKVETNERKRGRPTGKGRLPLSLEERRARNAQYERERRNEHAQAVTELVVASGLDPGLSVENLLWHVCCYFKKESRRGTDDNVDSLRQTNTDLLNKIEQAEANLAAPTPPQSPTDEEDSCMRTRTFIYIRRVKEEKFTIESSEITNKPIKTEGDMNDSPTTDTAFAHLKIEGEVYTQRKLHNPTKITEPIACETVKIKTEVYMETMPDLIHERKLHKRTAYATVNIRTEVDDIPDMSHERISLQGNVTEPRAHKKRKIDHNTAVAVKLKLNSADNTPTTKCKHTKAGKELRQETEQWPEENQLKADPLILGLFTEAEAKHDIVQYYINLLTEEGYDVGATKDICEQSMQQTNEDYAGLRTTNQG